MQEQQDGGYRICIWCRRGFDLSKQRVMCPHAVLLPVSERRIEQKIHEQVNEILTRKNWPDPQPMTPDFFLPSDHDKQMQHVPWPHSDKMQSIFGRAGSIGKRRQDDAGDHGLHIAQLHGCAGRSPHWSAVEHEHRLREPACVACGYTGKAVQVHHIKPFHLYPELELDQDNLITLCEAKGEEHHLLLGHLDSWQSYNEHIRDDVECFTGMNEQQIRASALWIKMRQGRP